MRTRPGFISNGNSTFIIAFNKNPKTIDFKEECFNGNDVVPYVYDENRLIPVDSLVSYIKSEIKQPATEEELLDELSSLGHMSQYEQFDPLFIQLDDAETEEEKLVIIDDIALAQQLYSSSLQQEDKEQIDKLRKKSYNGDLHILDFSDDDTVGSHLEQGDWIPWKHIKIPHD